MTTTPVVDSIEEARRIGPALRQSAKQSDVDARLPETTVSAMRDAGLFRLYVPRSLGGLEVDPITHMSVQEELARHDSAAGWLLQANVSDWWASRLPTETVEEIYAEGPDVIITGSFPAPVEATPVDGGYRITGRRAFASGVSSADWLWLTAIIVEDGRARTLDDGSPVVMFAFFPAGDANIVETWDSLGMRGTDTNDVEVNDLFVPERRTFRIGIDNAPNAYFEGPLYRAPVMVIVPTIVPAVSLGVAREAIDELVTLATDKTPFVSTTTLRERPSTQGKVGRAEGALCSARSFMYDRVGDGWRRSLAGEVLSLEERTALLLAIVQANMASLEAVDLMYSAAGTTAVYKRHRLERLFRDAQVLRQHGFMNESRYETVGQVRMGLAPDLAFVAL